MTDDRAVAKRPKDQDGGERKRRPATLQKSMPVPMTASTASNHPIDLNKVLPRISSKKKLLLDDATPRANSPSSQPATPLNAPANSPHGVSWSQNVEAQLKEVLQKKEEALQKKDEVIKEQEKRISKLVTDLMSTQLELRKAAYVDDSDLAASWGALEQKVRQLIPRYYDSTARDMISVAHLTVFKDLCKPDLLSRPELRSQLRRPLLESYIWRFLLRNVFGASGYIWAGKAHKAIANLKKELEDYELGEQNLIDGGEYMQWFSRTATLMDYVYKADPLCSSRLHDLAKTLKRELRFLEKDTIREGTVEEEFLRLVTAACELDFKMAKSNAGYYVFMYDVRDTSPSPPPCDLYGMEFDSENMEDTYYTGSARGRLSAVDVVRSPGIIKIGSGMGSDYGLPTVLVKRKVYCLPL